MVLQKYKTNVTYLNLYIIIFGPFLQIICVDRLIIIITIFKSPYQFSMVLLSSKPTIMDL